MKIVVTGTIGSGKSTLCAALATRLPGFSVVSVDDIVRSIYDDADFLTHLSNDFGVVSRKEASDLVFAAPTKRQALEQLSLRYVRPKLAAALDAENLIVEFPLLFEMSDFACRADLVVAVGCDDATQEARVVARDKMSLGNSKQSEQANTRAGCGLLFRTSTWTPEHRRNNRTRAWATFWNASTPTN